MDSLNKNIDQSFGVLSKNPCTLKTFNPTVNANYFNFSVVSIDLKIFVINSY